MKSSLFTKRQRFLLNAYQNNIFIMAAGMKYVFYEHFFDIDTCIIK